MECPFAGSFSQMFAARCQYNPGFPFVGRDIATKHLLPPGAAPVEAGIRSGVGT